MDNLLIIDTGGTFNKYYNPLNGELEVDQKGDALKDLLKRWLCSKIETTHIIGKDSLQMTNQDRFELLSSINQTTKKKIIIIHGTDTMDITAEYLAKNITKNKQIILTGAMVPYSIDPIEATANFAAALGYLAGIDQSGIYISMNGFVQYYHSLQKNRKEGRFVLKKT